MTYLQFSCSAQQDSGAHEWAYQQDRRGQMTVREESRGGNVRKPTKEVTYYTGERVTLDTSRGSASNHIVPHQASRHKARGHLSHH